MAEKKHTTLPPKLATDPAFVGASPSNDGYVTVLTPDNKPLVPGMADPDFDPNGLRMHMWTVNLHEADMRTAYYWWVCCCPCLPLAQLETRLGLNSFSLGLLTNLAAYSGRLFFFVVALIALCMGKFVTFAVCLALFVLCLIWVGQSVARVRIQTRERLAIAGSPKDDRRVGCVRSASAIRQMAVQLKCDQLHFGAPATLQAYQV